MSAFSLEAVISSPRVTSLIAGQGANANPVFNDEADAWSQRQPT
jgi:hypothetical protein